MVEFSTLQAWERYRDVELAALQPRLASWGYELDGPQVHLGGERHLTAGRKLVLVGRRRGDGSRVIIKASSYPAGIAEMERELRYRAVLEKINFAYHVFHSPPILLSATAGRVRVLITEFIEQERTFLDRPFEEQFFLALKAFEGLEGVHATTYGHSHRVRRVLGMWTAGSYLGELRRHGRILPELAGDRPAVAATLAQAGELLARHAEVVDRYASFLTHWDLVPHNLRVRGRSLYLLDHASLRFGSKYEGWARFVNFMALYHPELERSLVAYVAENRGAAEALALKVMRLYRLAELVWYYAQTLTAAEGNLRLLNEQRVRFWSTVFESVLNDAAVPTATIEAYCAERDALRDEVEKLRQRDLH